jgi:hypothetical protein
VGKLHQQTGYLVDGSERVDFEVLAEFDRVTEWKKDAWTKDRAFASNILDYLECASIIHSPDDA